MTTCDFTGVKNLNNLPLAQYVVAATDTTQTNPLNVYTFITDPNCALVILGTAGPTPTIGWGLDRRKRIPIEQFRQILKAQGNPWAAELEDTYEKIEKPKSKSKKLEKALDEIAQLLPERAAASINWGPLIVSLRSATEAKDAATALLHTQAAYRALLDEMDAEEAIIFLMWPTK